MQMTFAQQRGHSLRRRVLDVAVAGLGDRCAVAAPHAGRAHHADVRAGEIRQLGQKPLRAQHLAGQAFADPNGDLGRKGDPPALCVARERRDRVHDLAEPLLLE